MARRGCDDLQFYISLHHSDRVPGCLDSGVEGGCGVVDFFNHGAFGVLEILNNVKFTTLWIQYTARME